MRLVIRNIGALLSGDLDQPVLDADTVVCEDGRIVVLGADARGSAADIEIDARGTTVAPGLIDSHCHVVLGDSTPRQKAVDFLASYVHGGIASVVLPGETYTPGRPSGVVSLAIGPPAGQSGDACPDWRTAWQGAGAGAVPDHRPRAPVASAPRPRPRCGGAAARY